MLSQIIILFAVFSIELFFAISGLIGYTYQGAANDNIYIIYAIGVFIINILLSLWIFGVKNKKLYNNEIFFILFPVIVFAIYIFNDITSGGLNATATQFFMYFILWSVPAIYNGIIVNKLNLFQDIVKWLDIIMLIFTGALVRTTFLPFLRNEFMSSIGGATSQSAAYIAAVSYGINLYFLFFGKNHARFNFAKTKIYSHISKVLLIFQLLGVILSGGRGGFVLTVVYSVIIFIFILTDKNNKLKNRRILTVVIFLALISAAYTILIQNPVFKTKLDRSLAFIDEEGGIDWEGTSGRDNVYSDAIDLIKEKPILGYGLYGFWNDSDNPHNLFLEILLNGGVLYLLFSLIILIMLIKKIINMIRENIQNRMVLVIFIFPFVMLMFSGTYMVNTYFWFVTSLVFTYRLDAKSKQYN